MPLSGLAARTAAWVRRPLVASGLAVLVLASALAVVVGRPDTVAADGTPDIGVERSVEAEVLYGAEAQVSIVASNPSGPWAYNLSLRDVLPAGVAYVPGSAAPLGDPTTIAGPGAGQTTLIWENVADLAPGNTVALDYRVTHTTVPADGPSCSTTVRCVGDVLTGEVGAYVHGDPRYVPSFDADGLPVASSYTGWATDAASTTLVPFTVEKDEPNAEGEILRGVHDHSTIYTIRIENNHVAATDGLVVEDLLPAGLELLACGGIDHTTDAPTNPGSPLEYPGAPSLASTPAVPDCIDPTSVETVLIDPDGPEGPAGEAVHTRVRWEGPFTLAPSGVLEIPYAAGIPIRENTLDWTGPQPSATSGGQAANLDNNSGPETRDEQVLVNHATATGTYTGALRPGGEATHTVRDELVRTAEDLSVHKSQSTSAIAHGAIVRWGLLVETSEYRSVADVVVVDTLPDGLCPVGSQAPNAHPLGGATFDSAPFSSPLECGTGAEPSHSYADHEEQADGSWRVEFHLDEMSPSESVTISFPTQVRRNYQEDFADDVPVVARDAWSNQVALSGTQFVLRAEGAPIDHDPGYGDDVVIDDESSADQAADGDEIAKYIAEPIDETATCPAVSGDWRAAGDEELEFTHGDAICYRLVVEFNGSVDSRDPVVHDFIPPNTTYLDDSATIVAGSHTATLGQVEPYVGPEGALTWRPGHLPGSSEVCPATSPAPNGCFVDRGGVFDVAFAVIAHDDPEVGNDYDLVQNLMKYAAANSNAEIAAARVDVDYRLVEPEVSLDKAVDATAPLVQGDTATYTITVRNDGHREAVDVQVWDLLPDQLTCDDVVSASPATDGPCDPDLRDGRAGLVWTLAELPAAVDGEPGVATITYTVTLPDGSGDSDAVAAGEAIRNEAGVRGYEAETNLGGRVPYIPCDNIDPTLEGSCNTGPADDDATVTVLGATLDKSHGTDLTQTGNNAANQATIGELVEYTVTATIPADTSLYDAVITDPVPSTLFLVDDSVAPSRPSPVATLEVGGSSQTPVWLTSGLTWTRGAGDLRLELPVEYHTGDDDHVVTITYWAYVVDAASTDRGDQITNTARLTWSNADGSQDLSLQDSTTTRVVEPNLVVTKANDADAEGIQGGDVVEYTITVENRTASWVSTANGLVVTDTLPAGLTVQPPHTFDPSAADADVATLTVAGSGTTAEPFVVTWTFREDLEIAPGGSLDLTYQVTVDDAVVAGVAYENTVDATTTGLPDGYDGGPERSYEDEDDSVVSAMAPPLTKSVEPAVRTIGEAASYDITFTLPANVDVYDLTVVDVLPDGLALVDGSLTCESDGSDVCPTPLAAATSATTRADGTTRVVWFLDDVGVAATPRQVTLGYEATVLDAYADGDPVVAGDALDNVAGIWWNTSDRVDDAGDVPDDPSDFDVDGPEDDARVTVVEPHLVIDKQVDGEEGNPIPYGFDVDQTLTYSITITNDGTSPAHDVRIGDDLPEGLTTTFTEACSTTAALPLCDEVVESAVPSESPTGATWSFPGPLAPGESVTFTYTAVVTNPALVQPDPDPVDANRFVNVATIDAYHGVEDSDCADDDPSHRCYGLDHDDPDPGYTDDVTVEPGLLADVSIVKRVVDADGVAVTDPEVDAGQTVRFRLRVQNHGPTPALGPVVVTDDLPTGLTYSSISAPSGWSCAEAGGTITCTHAGDLPVDALADIVVSATVDGDAPTTVVNRASVDHPTTEPCGPGDTTCDDNDESEVTVTTSHVADLALSKSLVGDGPWYVGGDATFGLVVTNAGPSASVASAEAPITIVDTLPAGLTYTGATGTDWSCAADGQVVTCSYTGGTVPVGGQLTVLLDVRIDAPTDDPSSPLAADGGTALNVATVFPGDTPEPTDCVDGDCTPDNSDDEPLPVTPLADLELAKEADHEIVVGTSATYTFTVTNHGPSTAAGPIVLVDELPVGLTYEDHDGDGWTCEVALDDDTGRETVTCTHAGDLVLDATSTLTMVVSVGPEVDDDVANAASVSSPTTDPDPDNNDDGTTDPSTPSVDLAIVKTALDVPMRVGDEATYAIDVTNNGLSTSSGTITVTDTLPAGLTFLSADGEGWTCVPPSAGGSSVECALDETVPMGGSFTRLVVTVAVGPEAYPEITNVASVTPPPGHVDPVSENDDDPEQTPILPLADLEIAKSHDGDLVTGQPGTYRIVVTNHGPTPDPGPITVVDQLPPGLTFAGASEGWECAPGADDPQQVTCRYVGGELAVDDSLVLDLVVEVGVLAEGESVNRARVSTSEGTDPDPSNDEAEDPTTVLPSADLRLRKTHDGGFVAGEDAVWLLAVDNLGPSTATGPIVVTDEVPDGLVVRSATGEGWECTVDGQTVTCVRDAVLPVGAAPVITVTVGLPEDLVGDVVNTASVAGTDLDPDPSNDEGSDTAEVVPSPVDPADPADVSDAAGSAGTGPLPRTGSDPSWLLRLGVLALSVGGVMTALGRRTRRASGR